MFPVELVSPIKPIVPFCPNYLLRFSPITPALGSAFGQDQSLMSSSEDAVVGIDSAKTRLLYAALNES